MGRYSPMLTSSRFSKQCSEFRTNGKFSPKMLRIVIFFIKKGTYYLAIKSEHIDLFVNLCKIHDIFGPFWGIITISLWKCPNFAPILSPFLLPLFHFWAQWRPWLTYCLLQPRPFSPDMRKVQICPQTRFCGFEMATLFAVNDRQITGIWVRKKVKSIK